MNVQGYTQKPHGRLADLSPFDPEQPASQPKARQDEYGCVEWFSYRPPAASAARPDSARRDQPTAQASRGAAAAASQR